MYKYVFTCCCSKAAVDIWFITVFMDIILPCAVVINSLFLTEQDRIRFLPTGDSVTIAVLPVPCPLLDRVL